MAELLVRTRPARYLEPAGDPGWFGPESVTWLVHSDLPSMLVGGLSALYLQTLHPLVMQGVEDHSGYRSDPFGRLQRTAEFIAATTYGGDALAWAFVRKVRAIHDKVTGTGPGGRTYRAADPDLLAYVHVTEVWSFLRAHQRYSGHLLVREEKDRYLEEMALVARRLGAAEVPVTTEGVRRYLREMRPELAGSPLARRTVAFIMSPRPGASLLERASHTVMAEAGVDLLPEFARRALGLYRPSPARVGLVRPAGTLFAGALRFVAGSSPLLEAAHARVAS